MNSKTSPKSIEMLQIIENMTFNGPLKLSELVSNPSAQKIFRDETSGVTEETLERWIRELVKELRGGGRGKKRLIQVSEVVGKPHQVQIDKLTPEGRRFLEQFEKQNVKGFTHENPQDKSPTSLWIYLAFVGILFISFIVSPGFSLSLLAFFLSFILIVWALVFKTGRSFDGNTATVIRYTPLVLLLIINLFRSTEYFLAENIFDFLLIWIISPLIIGLAVLYYFSALADSERVISGPFMFSAETPKRLKAGFGISCILSAIYAGVCGGILGASVVDDPTGKTTGPDSAFRPFALALLIVLFLIVTTICLLFFLQDSGRKLAIVILPFWTLAGSIPVLFIFNLPHRYFPQYFPLMGFPWHMKVGFFIVWLLVVALCLIGIFILASEGALVHFRGNEYKLEFQKRLAEDLQNQLAAQNKVNLTDFALARDLDVADVRKRASRFIRQGLLGNAHIMGWEIYNRTTTSTTLLGSKIGYTDKNPVLAAFLSFLIPGLGQLYAGATTRGIILLLIAFIIFPVFAILGITFLLAGLGDPPLFFGSPELFLLSLLVISALSIVYIIFYIFAIVDAAYIASRGYGIYMTPV